MSRPDQTYRRIDHPIPPLYDKDSRILILGSFPSVKSREAAFFYGHPRNRFWEVVSGLLSQPLPVTVEEKKAFLHQEHIALWDSIKSCDIIGSSDSSIRNVEANDLSVILETAGIRQIFCNGAKSHEYYDRYIRPVTGMPAVKLPSTSPANAAFSSERLMREWKQILKPLKAAHPATGKVLLGWYDYNARILPWRSDPTPYHVWISEIMLQQTRVEAVIPYYERWMEALPDIESLAMVPEDRLLKLWEGLGYYNRARNLKKAAVTVMEDYGGELPTDYTELLKLSGIGEYTAGAVASIAFGLPEPAVDGNALRVFARLLGEDGEITGTAVKKSLTAEIRRVLPKDRPGDFNQAIMDLGSAVCLPTGRPDCPSCPFEADCQARRLGQETVLPVRKKKKDRRIEKKTVFVIELAGEEGRQTGYVLHRRPDRGLLPDLWEFPGVRGHLSTEEAGDLAGQWGLEDFCVTALGEARHIFTHVEWQMKGYLVKTGKVPEDLCRDQSWIIVSGKAVRDQYAVPSAFEYYKKQVIE